MGSMASATRRPPKTRADLEALPEDVRAELIRGEIYVTPSPSDAHQRVSLRLAVFLDDWARSQRAGAVRYAPLDVHLPTGDVVQPDLVFVSTENLAIMQPDGIHGAPDLAVEIVSSAHPERDRIVKRALYAQAGVVEYWIVELEQRAIEVLRLDGGDYVPAGWFREGHVLTSPPRPGLDVPVAEVFCD